MQNLFALNEAITSKIRDLISSDKIIADKILNLFSLNEIMPDKNKMIQDMIALLVESGVELQLAPNFKDVYTRCPANKFSKPITVLLSKTQSDVFTDIQVYNNLFELSRDDTLYNIMYTTTLDKNFHIKIIKNFSLDEGLYSPVTKELIVADNYGSFPKKNFMHELSHKLMHQIFSDARNPFTSKPYDNEKDKADFEDAVGRMLDNILLNYYKIDNLQSILELKEDYYSSSNYERGSFIAKLYLPLVVKEGNDEFLQFIVKHFENIEWDLIDDWFDYKETAEPLLLKLYNIVTEQDTDLLEFIALHLKDINLDKIESFVERPNITQALLKVRNIDQDSLMESWKCNQVIGNLIGIFSPYTLEKNEHYTAVEMDGEIIVRYPEAIAENCYENNSVIQSIFDPIKVYWENVIEIRMNEYNLRHDKSEYCAANDSIWDFI